MTIKRGDREITGAGHLPAPGPAPGRCLQQAPISFTAKLANADLSLLPTILQELHTGEHFQQCTGPWAQTVASGAVNASLTVGGTLAARLLEGFAQLDNGTYGRTTWKTLTKLQANVTVRSTGGVNRVEVAEASGQRNQAIGSPVTWTSTTWI